MTPPADAWEAEQGARGLLDLLRRNASRRKLRWCVCECLRSVLPAGVLAADAEYLAFAERVADDEAGVDVREWNAVQGRLVRRFRPLSDGPSYPGDWLMAAVGVNIHAMAYRLLDVPNGVGLGQATARRLLREVFGNPFRPVEFAPWRTGTATALARGMYESRDFGAMPILADALRDAGCDDPDVLAHCRDPHATHVRGCWVVDGVLGKE